MTFNSLFESALNNYKSYKDITAVLIKIGDKKNNDELYLLSGGKKKGISKRAIKGYMRIFSLNIEYTFYDFYKYENIFFSIALLFYKFGFRNLSNFYNKLGAKILYKRISKNIVNFPW